MTNKKLENIDLKSQQSYAREKAISDAKLISSMHIIIQHQGFGKDEIVQMAQTYLGVLFADLLEESRYSYLEKRFVRQLSYNQQDSWLNVFIFILVECFYFMLPLFHMFSLTFASFFDV